MRLKRSTRSSIAAAGCAVLFTAVLVGVYHTAQGRWLDNAALEGFLSTVDNERRQAVADAVASLCDPGPFLLIGVHDRRGRPHPARPAARGGRHRAAPRRRGDHADPQAAAGQGALRRRRRRVRPLRQPGDRRARVPERARDGGDVARARGADRRAARTGDPWSRRSARCSRSRSACPIVALAWHFPSDIVGGYLVATTWCLSRSPACAPPTRAGPSPARCAQPRARASRPRAGRSAPRPRWRPPPAPASRSRASTGSSGFAQRPHHRDARRDRHLAARGGARRGGLDRRPAPRLKPSGERPERVYALPRQAVGGQGSPVRNRRGPATVTG